MEGEGRAHEPRAVGRVRGLSFLAACLTLLAWAAAPVSAQNTDTDEQGICGRTDQVETALVDAIDGVVDCALVTDAHLAAITSLTLRGRSLSSDDMRESVVVRTRWRLDAIDGVVDCALVTDAHLAAITSLTLRDPSLSSLHSGDFEGLSGLTRLTIDDSIHVRIGRGRFRVFPNWIRSRCTITGG